MDDSSGFDAAEVLDLGRPPRRRPVRAAAAAVAAVAIASALLWNHSRGPGSLAAATVPDPVSTTVPASAVPSPSAATVRPSASGEPNKARTITLVRRLLADAPVLPGAKSRSRAPQAELKDFGGSTGDSVIQRLAWWTAPGDVDAALSYFTDHVASGLASDGSSSGSSGNGPTVEGLSFSTPDTTYAQAISLQVQVVPYHGGVGVGVMAEATWTPERLPATIVTDPSSMAVTIVRRSHRSVHQVFGKSVSDAFARIVNGLTPLPPGEMFSCPIEWGGMTDTLVFSTPSGSITVTTTPDGCQFVDVSAGGHAQTFYGGSVDGGAIDAAVLKALGLPVGYGLPSS